jgi:hypothetical protein
MSKASERTQFKKGNPGGAMCKLSPPAGAADIIRGLTAKGVSEVSLAKALGVSRHTWENWRDENPEIRAAWEEGRGQMHDKLVSSLFEAATEKGNIVAGIFLLKSVFNYRENVDTAVQNKVQLIFEVPASMDPDKYLKVVREIPKERLTDGQ